MHDIVKCKKCKSRGFIIEKYGYFSNKHKHMKLCDLCNTDATYANLIVKNRKLGKYKLCPDCQGTGIHN